MKILHFSTRLSGGAGSAAYRLHKNLQAHGIDSRMAVLHQDVEDPAVYPCRSGRTSPRYADLGQRVENRLLRRRDYLFSDQGASKVEPARVREIVDGFRPDFCVYHFISGMLSPEDVVAIHQWTGSPAVWYLMDMATLTGGCHYAWDCLGYHASCGSCPALRLGHPGDGSRRTWLRKQAMVERVPTAVAAPTSWLADQSRASSLFGSVPTWLIPIAIDPETFNPGLREQARATLGLADRTKVLFWGIAGLHERRKGGTEALRALARLAADGFFQGDDRLVLTAGDDRIAVALAQSRIPNRHLGRLRGDKELARAFAAADVFLCPSIEDSGPMMINEAQMSGTPVVAFRMGVAPDLVLPGRTGYLARLGDCEDLAEGVRKMLASLPGTAAEMSTASREKAMEFCHPDRQCDGFISLFRSLEKSQPAG